MTALPTVERADPRPEDRDDAALIARCLALYGSPEYFVRRPRPPLAQDYWAPKADPDGRVRDVRADRAARMADVRYIADALNALPPGRILDVGCGFGELLEQIAPHHEAFGLDTSAQALAVCETQTAARLEAQELDRAFPDVPGFDAVVAHHLIEHLDDPVAFVRQVARRLRPGGLFVCGTPDFASAAARRFGARFRLLHDPTHISLFTEDSLIRLLRDSGFTVQGVEKPFFETRYATAEACERMLEGTAPVSPAFYGSIVTVFATRDAGAS